MKTERDYQVRVPADDWREFETEAERESLPPTVLARAVLKRFVAERRTKREATKAVESSAA